MAKNDTHVQATQTLRAFESCLKNLFPADSQVKQYGRPGDHLMTVQLDHQPSSRRLDSFHLPGCRGKGRSSTTLCGLGKRITRWWSKKACK